MNPLIQTDDDELGELMRALELEVQRREEDELLKADPDYEVWLDQLAKFYDEHELERIPDDDLSEGFRQAI